MLRCIIVLLSIIFIMVLGGCGHSTPLSPAHDVDDAALTGGIDYGGDILQKNLAPVTATTALDHRTMPRWLDDELLVVLHDGVDPMALHQSAKGLGLSPINEIRLMWGTVWRMHIDSGMPVVSVVGSLSAYPEVRIAEPNYIFYPCSVPYYPNDPLFEYSGLIYYFGAGLRTYKDIVINETAYLNDDPYPIFSDLVLFAEDHEPPVWDTTYAYVGTNPNTIFAVKWDVPANPTNVGNCSSDGALGLFFDGEYLYAAEQEDGLKILM